MPIDFEKYHALGNDYIVIDPAHTDVAMSVENIRLLCNRNLGIGSDGILYGPLFEEDTIKLRIFNPDGSEAEKSGNGVRIFSRYLMDAGYTTEENFTLHTLGGVVAVEILDAQTSLIRIDMGTVTFQSNLIPVAGESREMVATTLEVGESLKVTCLSIGNPHCVIPLDAITRQLAIKLGPLIEEHPMFPNRINVQLMKVLDRGNIQIEIWERGAGYTMASGSSSCAAASAAFKLGLTDNAVRVHMPGGIIDIDICPDGHVLMTGTVCHVARGEFSTEFRAQLG